MCICEEKTSATKVDAVWWTNCARVRSTTGFCNDQEGIFGIRKGAAVKTEWSSSIFVNILKEQKFGESEKRACQQSSINDRVGWWMSDKRRALNLRDRNLCLMFKGISPQAWSRQITRVLAMAPVHKRNASFWILCNGFRRLYEPFRWSVTPAYSHSFSSGSWVPSCRIKDTDAGLCFLVNSTAADLVLESLKPHLVPPVAHFC